MKSDRMGPETTKFQDQNCKQILNFDRFYVEIRKTIFKLLSMYYRYEQINQCADVVRRGILTLKEGRVYKYTMGKARNTFIWKD